MTSGITMKTPITIIVGAISARALLLRIAPGPLN
jgi:hypothetical protein